MDILQRKMHFIQEVLRLKNEEIVEKLEKILHQEKQKITNQELNPMTIEEFYSLIDQAEKDSDDERLYSTDSILRDIDEWK